MAVICNTCGLPEDLCACGELDKDSSQIIIRLEERRFRKKGRVSETKNRIIIKANKSVRKSCIILCHK